MSNHPRQLPIPPIAADDLSAREAIRVWVAGGRQHFTIAAKIWDDPAAWGIMLVDLAKHISRAYSQSSSFQIDDALNRLRQGFDLEWSSATDVPTGEILKPHAPTKEGEK